MAEPNAAVAAQCNTAEVSIPNPNLHTVVTASSSELDTQVYLQFVATPKVSSMFTPQTKNHPKYSKKKKTPKKNDALVVVVVYNCDDSIKFV